MISSNCTCHLHSHVLTNTSVAGRYTEGLLLLPDACLFYGYSTFLLMTAYEASWKGTFTSELQLYLPIILCEVFSIVAVVLTVPLAHVPLVKTWYIRRQQRSISHALNNQPMTSWTSSVVTLWLTKEINGGRYDAVSLRREITGKRLLNASDDELRQLGFSNSLQRKKIRLAIFQKARENGGENAIVEISSWSARELDEERTRQLGQKVYRSPQ